MLLASCFVCFVCFVPFCFVVFFFFFFKRPLSLELLIENSARGGSMVLPLSEESR